MAWSLKNASWLRLCYDLFLRFNCKMLEYDVFSSYSIPVLPGLNWGYLQGYFKDVDMGLKAKLFRVFQDELEFYYTIYPEEWGMHRNL